MQDISMPKLGQKEWVIKVNDDVAQMDDSSNVEMFMHWKKRSIYQLPASFTYLNKSAYMPQTVSFGPYHHGQEHLQPMEEHKHRALLHFLKRSNKPVDCYIESLAPVMQDLKDSYDSLDAVWQQNTDAFLQLMILDGCFMLEILRVVARDRTRSIRSSLALEYPSNDPIFSDHAKLYIMPNIKRDILLLENQLPMLVLHSLLAVQNDKIQREDYLHNLILDFCSPSAPVLNLGKRLHMLDAHRACLLFDWRGRSPRLKTYALGKIQVFDMINRSASELKKARIRFRRSKTRSLIDISFHDGILNLPLVIVDDITESMFRNLIAFERYHIGAGTEVTSYIFFMSNIIDNATDVSILHEKCIIQNFIGSDEDVAKLFSSFSKDTRLDPDSTLYDVHICIESYCRKPWNEWRATLIYSYFRNLIHTTTVVAGIVLFALTAIQTVFTVYPTNG